MKPDIVFLKEFWDFYQRNSSFFLCLILSGIRMGLDPKLLASILNTSSGRCWSSDTYNPVPGVIEGIPPSKVILRRLNNLLKTDLGIWGRVWKCLDGKRLIACSKRRHQHLCIDCSCCIYCMILGPDTTWVNGSSNLSSSCPKS